VTLLDTAGIRDSADPVEQEGVRRARERAAAADLVLWVVEAGEPEVANKPPSMSGLSQKAGDHMQADSSARWLETPHWLVVNKIDSMNSSTNINVKVTDQVQSFRISAKTGAEVNSLIQALADFATGTLAGEPALVSRERHRRFLIETQSALDRALAEGPTGREDIIAEELRLAARALGRLTGRVDVEDILDVIFRDFCIGK
jgi:tRNA modification GTPase